MFHHRRTATVFLLAALTSSLAMASDDAAVKRWGDYVREAADVLIEHGTDHYGKTHSGMFMAILDPKDYTSPEEPEFLDTDVFYEHRPHRRVVGGTNAWYDQALYRVLYELTERTGDKKYADAANAAIAATFQYTINPQTNLPCWGSHIFYNAYKDAPDGDLEGKGPHETLVYLPEWDKMYDVNPEAVKRIADAVWERHVCDKKTGQFNRHDECAPGCDFAFSAGPFITLFSTVYAKTGDERYLDYAKTIVDWHWQHRNLETNLIPDSPSTDGRYDATHCFTSVTGPYASHLLRAYELTGEEVFRDRAITYLKAYDRYGYDPKAETYWAMIQLDGTPVPGTHRGSGYADVAPFGHVDMWKNTIFSYEFPPAAAQSYIYAYEITAKENNGQGDPELLAGARRWAKAIEKELPIKVAKRWGPELKAALPKLAEVDGSYADDYGRVISFFVHMYQATGEEQYLETAQTVAKDAVAKLYENKLFKAHPAKPYYESTAGVGLLLNALLELDTPEKKWRLAL